jgi:hypothetical protein
MNNSTCGRIILAHWVEGRFRKRNDMPPIDGGPKLRVIEGIPRAALAEIFYQLNGEPNYNNDNDYD